MVFGKKITRNTQEAMVWSNTLVKMLVRSSICLYVINKLKLKLRKEKEDKWILRCIFFLQHYCSSFILDFFFNRWKNVNIYHHDEWTIQNPLWTCLCIDFRSVYTLIILYLVFIGMTNNKIKIEGSNKHQCHCCIILKWIVCCFSLFRWGKSGRVGSECCIYNSSEDDSLICKRNQGNFIHKQNGQQNVNKNEIWRVRVLTVNLILLAEFVFKMYLIRQKVTASKKPQQQQIR